MSDTQEILEDTTTENLQENKYLLFHLGPEQYGVTITHIINIIEIQKITPIPDMPDYLPGVINLRGQVIPVMDLRLRFGMPAREYDDRTCIIIVKQENTHLGLVVDTVAEVVAIPQKDVEPPTESGKHGKMENFISGLGKFGDKVKILINVQAILEGHME